jgi:hypothetical protein
MPYSKGNKNKRDFIMGKKKKIKVGKISQLDIKVRNSFLMFGPIKEQTTGTKKGKKGYSRKKKHKNKDID